MVTENPDAILYGESVLARLGRVMISFTEPTLAGLTERRVLFDGSLDVDMIPMTPGQLAGIGAAGAAVLEKGYRVLLDKLNVAETLAQAAKLCQRESMESEAFVNLCGDFWYHTVWAAKKLRRGEAWTAKMCVDSYMKGLLLRLIEIHSASRGRVVWHSGRMLEKWAEPWVLAELPKCFGCYGLQETAAALEETVRLFSRLSRECAAALGYPYSLEAENYARAEYRALLEER